MEAICFRIYHPSQRCQAQKREHCPQRHLEAEPSRRSAPCETVCSLFSESTGAAMGRQRSTGGISCLVLRMFLMLVRTAASCITQRQRTAVMSGSRGFPNRRRTREPRRWTSPVAVIVCTARIVEIASAAFYARTVITAPRVMAAPVVATAMSVITALAASTVACAQTARDLLDARTAKTVAFVPSALGVLTATTAPNVAIANCIPVAKGNTAGLARISQGWRGNPRRAGDT
jgi:hypothetical protein